MKHLATERSWKWQFSATSRLIVRDKMGTKNNKDKILIDYGKLTNNAFQRVIHDLLKSTSENGLQGQHHFYITFYTRSEHVIIPEDLKEIYPEEMTIVIQNSFWDLKVEKNYFSITLSFNSIKKKMLIPFNAILNFTDPHANFSLNFPKILNKNDLYDKTNNKASNVISIQNFKKEK